MSATRMRQSFQQTDATSRRLAGSDLTPTPWRGGPYNVPRVIANHGGHIIVEVTLPNEDPSRDDDLTLQIQIDPLAVEVVAYVADMELGSKVWGLSGLHEGMY